MAKNLRVFVSLVHVGRLLFKTLNVLYNPNSLVTPKRHNLEDIKDIEHYSWY
jgi:hypothetical protein